MSTKRCFRDMVCPYPVVDSNSLGNLDESVNIDVRVVALVKVAMVLRLGGYRWPDGMLACGRVPST